MKKKAIIVDLDGTLSDSSHRQHFMTQKKKDWDAFYNALSDDPPNKWCLELSDNFYNSGYSIVLVTGRPSNYIDKTEVWLDLNQVSYERLIMRTEGDYRPDYIIKQEIYEKHIKNEFDVLFAVDDRKQVVDMWRKNGITCLQCAEGDF